MRMRFTDQDEQAKAIKENEKRYKILREELRQRERSLKIKRAILVLVGFFVGFFGLQVLLRIAGGG